MVEISKIRKNFTNVYCEGEIEKISEPKTINLKSGGTAQIVEAILKDSTGSIPLQLWDESIKMVKAGSKVKVENGYTTSFKGETKLNTGKYGKLVVLTF